MGTTTKHAHHGRIFDWLENIQNKAVIEKTDGTDVESQYTGEKMFGTENLL